MVNITEKIINNNDVKISSIDDAKIRSYAERMTTEIKSNEDAEIERHKLMTDKPRFPSSLSVDHSSFAYGNPVSDLSVSEEFNPDTVQSIPNTLNIYDIYHESGTNDLIQESISTDQSKESRLRPIMFVDKISKLFILKK